MFDDMELEYEYGTADWLNEQLEETWLEALDNFLEDEMHKGENPDELDD
jgi:hypothetical protein